MDFSAYLSQLGSEQLDRLYDSPWTCQAVLRSLPPLCQHFVLQQLFLAEPLPVASVHAGVKQSAAAKRDAALAQLLRLQVLHRSKGHCSLNRIFRARLQQSVLNPISVGQAQTVPPASSVAEINAFGAAQWQQVLLALVDGRRATLKPHKDLRPLDVRSLFLAADLLDDSLELSDAGFKFLFLDVYSQLWQLLQRYLATVDHAGEHSLADALSFLLQLSFRKASQPVPASQLAPEQRSVAAHMVALGLLKPDDVGGDVLLCPTFLAALLCGGAASTAGAAGGSTGFIVVETSFRLYAYTSSPVQIAILQLFVRTDCLLPNMFIGTLTAKSITAALRRGISAATIVRYLEEHRHAQVAHRAPVVPEAVADQVLLWERELNRLQCTAAVMYEAFESAALFEGACACAEGKGAVLLRDDALRRLVVKVQAHDAVRAAIQELRVQGNG